MPKKPLTSLVNLPQHSTETPIVRVGCSETTPQKPFTKKKATSAGKINVWSTAEFDAGLYYPDLEEAKNKAVTSGLKAEKLG